MFANRGRRRLLRSVAAVVASLLLIPVLAGVASADVGTVTVTAQTPSPVELGATATFTVGVHNTDGGSRRFAVTGVSDANGVAISGVTVVDSGCASIAGDGTSNLTVQIGTTSGTPIGSLPIRLTVSQYNSNSQNCNSSVQDTGTGSGTLVTMSTKLTIVLYQVACPSYQYIPANEDPTTLDATGGHAGELNASAQLVAAAPSDIDTVHGCAGVAGWQLNLHRGSSGGTLISSPATTGVGGFATVNLTTAADIAAARTGSGVWVDEVVPAGYGFGAIRCYNDMLYGDNSENVDGVPSSVTQVYCLAFNYRPVLTITATNQAKAYGSTLTLGTSAFTTSGLLSGDHVNSVTLTSAGAAAGAAAGNYPIVPSAAAGNGLAKYTIVYANGTLAVSAIPLTITATNQTKVYGSAAALGTSAFTTSGLLSGDTVTGVTLTSAGAAAGAAVGNYTIVPSAAAGSGIGNYTITYANGTLAVSAKALTITANNQAKAYGSALDLGTTAFTATGLVNGNTVTAVTLTSAGAAAGAAVGNYIIVPSAAAGSGLGNYTISYANGTLAVSAKTLTITATNQAKAYGATLDLGTTAFTAIGLVNGDTVSAVTLTSAGAAAGATVGNYSIVPSAATGSGLGNYTITYANGTLAVSAKPLTITATNQAKVYGSALDLGTTAFTATGLLSGDTITGVTLTSAGAAAGAGVGDYTIVPSAATGSGLSGYTITYANGTLGVTKATLTVTAPNGTKVQGANNPAFTPTYGGFAGGDTASSLTTQPTCSTTAVVGSPAGTYPVTCSGGVADNYSFSYVQGTLTVTAPAATQTPAPTVAPSQSLLGATGAPHATPPATNSSSDGSGNTGAPLFALLICLAFGTLAILMVEKQRRTVRR